MKKLITPILSLLATFNVSAQLKFNEIRISPGIESSDPQRLTAINGTIYFAAYNSNQGLELWATDGTPNNTRLVKDIFPGVASSNPRNFTLCNGKIFFLADSIYTNSLWVTDGTTTGTQLVKNSSLNDFAALGYMGEVNGKLILTAKNASEGIELWESDGTSAGTKLLKDINQGTGDSYPGPYVLYNNKLYFRANDGTSQELWYTDGTAAGTVKCGNISYPGTVLNDVCVLNNNIYYTATDIDGRKLYKSDGTIAGTTSIAALNTHNGYPNVYTESAVIDDKLYFASDDQNRHYTLWVTDGTTAGTSKLMEVTDSLNYGFIKEIMSSNGKVYFVYEHKWQHIYSTDGTAAGTKEVEAFAKYTSGNPFDLVMNLTAYNGSLYFTAYSSNKSTTQLYAITQDTQVHNIKPRGNTLSNTMPGGNRSICVFNKKLFTSATFNSNEGFELWSIEGTPTGISNTTAKATNTFTLYPNPATDVLHIKTGSINKQASIRIVNQLGQSVLAEDITNKNTISLQGIAPGIYTATIDADGQRETQQLTIQ